ncbi:flagellin [Clostridium cylindrosporum]|uniref:Flagellin n=1 Tax=Clostridium cylindrosporum DSM 605 TaxID=1121307 RepID=A0A0J8DA12_CLOCY|nr:flagellin [Clostridium cylindrosporum]KMT22895.1 flagellin [Clostridium cylindrosporum DSM 605]
MNINHNMAAVNAYNNYNKNISDKSKAMMKISTGARINKASDDAAGASISEKMKGQIRGLQQASRNIQDGISLIRTAEGGLASIENPNLVRMRELCIQALNDTLTYSDRQHIQTELANIEASIDGIATDTEFNEINVLAPPMVKYTEDPPKTEEPSLDIVFLIDDSATMGEEIQMVKDGIGGFVESLQDTISTRIAFVSLCDLNTNNPESFKDFSSNPNLDHIQIESASTRPYDAIIESMPGGSVGSKLSYNSNSKKVFVLFTDTYNESGGGTSESTSKKVEGSNVKLGYDNDDVQVYNFLFDGDQYDSVYKEITDTTGGKIYHPSTTEDIKNNLINDLVNDIKGSLPEPSTPTEEKWKMKDVILQVGPNSSQQFVIDLFDARCKSLGIYNLSVLSREDANDALTRIDNAMLMVSGQRANFGAYTNALEHISNNVENSNLNLNAANSRIEDADISLEVIKSAKSGILADASQRLLIESLKLSDGIINMLGNFKNIN